LQEAISIVSMLRRISCYFMCPSLRIGTQPWCSNSNGRIHQRRGAAQEGGHHCNRGLASAVPCRHPTADRRPQLWCVRNGVCRVPSCWLPSAAVWHQCSHSSASTRAHLTLDTGESCGRTTVYIHPTMSCQQLRMMPGSSNVFSWTLCSDAVRQGNMLLGVMSHAVTRATVAACRPTMAGNSLEQQMASSCGA
jgi:hypothetical protein